MPYGVYDRTKSKPNSGLFQKGKPSWNKGKKHSEEHKRKMQENHADFDGSNHPNWKGGRKIHRGYVLVRNIKHPYQSKGYVREHRIVVEKIIGRYLLPKEEVHHLGEKDDNRPCMLMAFTSRSAHKRFEKEGVVKPKEIIFDGRKT